MAPSQPRKPWIVPYSTLGTLYGQEEIDAVAELLLGDPEELPTALSRFSEAFGQWIGCRYALPVSSCTAALHLATMALGLGPGDEVITTPQTFYATTRPLFWEGVAVRFGDIDPRTMNLDPRTIAGLITPRTRAIYVMHYGGCPVDMDAVLAVAGKHGLAVVEDAAHALGGQYKGSRLGTLGDAGCFSFHYLKNLGCGGEGGMLVTDDASMYRRAVAAGTLQVRERENEAAGAGDAVIVGYKYTLSPVQAAIGCVQLQKLEGFQRRRQSIAQRLNDALARIDGLEIQQDRSDDVSAHHLYVFFVDEERLGCSRDEFVARLRERGIDIQQRYHPLHLMPEYQREGHRRGDCPITERVYFHEQVNLPIYPHLSDSMVDTMIRSVVESAAESRR